MMAGGLCKSCFMRRKYLKEKRGILDDCGDSGDYVEYLGEHQTSNYDPPPTDFLGGQSRGNSPLNKGIGGRS